MLNREALRGLGSAFLIMIAATGCAHDQNVTTGQSDEPTGRVTFESEVSKDFLAAVAKKANPSGPSLTSAPGVAVYVAPPSAVPRRDASSDSVDEAAESQFVQEAAIYVAPYDGTEPYRVRLPGNASHRLRRVVAAAASGGNNYVAMAACQRAYYYESGDDRPYGCSNELWLFRDRGEVAVPLALPEGVAANTTAVSGMAATGQEVRLNHSLGFFVGSPDGSQWTRLSDGIVLTGPNRMCAFKDGSVLTMDVKDDQVLSLLPAGEHAWTTVVSEPTAAVGLNELNCAPSAALRVPFGPFKFPMVLVVDAKASLIDNPLADKMGPTGWVADQKTDEFVAPAPDGLYRISRPKPEVESIGGSVERFTDSAGQTRQVAAPGGAPYHVADDGSITLEPFPA